MKTIQLTPEIEALINQQIETGQYQNDLAVIAQGLSLLVEREKIYKGRFEELKQEVMIGVEQLQRGEGIEGEVVFAELENDIRQVEAKMLSMKGEKNNG